MGFFKKIKKAVSNNFKNPFKQTGKSLKALSKGKVGKAFQHAKSGSLALSSAEVVRAAHRDAVIGTDDYLKNNPEAATAVGAVGGFVVGGVAGAQAGAALAGGRATAHVAKKNAKKQAAAQAAILAQEQKNFDTLTDALSEDETTAFEDPIATAKRLTKQNQRRRQGRFASIRNAGGAGGLTSPNVSRGGFL